MTDLRALLHEAAPAPSTRVNVDTLVIEAARRRRTRRPWLWFASVAVVLGIGGGAAGVLAPASRPARVETLPGPAPVEEVGGPAIAPVATPQPGAHAAASSRSKPTPDDAGAPFAASGDAWEGCVAEGHDEGVQLGYNGGLSASDTPTCRYEAHRPGGYQGHGTWTLEIRRGVDDIVYRGGESPDCMPVGTIQPGDVVTVKTSAGSEAEVTGSPYIRVGPDFGC